MIGIVDTGCANIASLSLALERLDVTPFVSADPNVLKGAERLVLPGVGSASYAMRKLRERGLVDLLRGWTRPLLGICLGLQLLTERSLEGEEPVECLGLLKGDVVPLATKELALPHIGWNALDKISAHALFAGIPTGSYFYFVHSYALANQEQAFATCDYGNSFVCAAGSGSIWGVQFHPERSGAAGAQLLKNFLSWEGS